MEIARRSRPRKAYGLPLGATTVYLSHDDYDVDWASFAFVAVDDAYAGDYGGVVVVDVGAHKGYYGAYALAHGARAVVSYEPERANFALLQGAATSARGLDWQTRQCAVGAQRGEAELHVMGASWGHALQPPAAFAEYGLDDPALGELARIVHGADVSGDEDCTPESRGLKAIAEGFQLAHADDHEILRREFAIYDALYAWCQARVTVSGATP